MQELAELENRLSAKTQECDELKEYIATATEQVKVMQAEHREQLMAQPSDAPKLKEALATAESEIASLKQTV